MITESPLRESAKNLSAQAYERLLDMILRGTLATGTLLQEQALADELQISRTPVRAALLKLEAEGLLKRHAGRLLIVREMLVREYIEILRVRVVLESEAIGKASQRISREELSNLRQVFQTLMSGSHPDVETQTRADDRLHGMIVNSCDNAVLADIVQNLRRRTRIFNLKSLPERFIPGCMEHLEIVSALERRDEETARRVLVAHLENVKESILRKLGTT
jgi:DNA-binding GntR family transcriptional regulator